MEYLFKDIEETLYMLEGAYKKLKAHLYFDKTLLFLKKRLAIFESDREYFEKTLKEIADNLSAENMCFFEDLIKSINFRILPKKFSSIHEDTNIIKSYVDHDEQISKVNFFIDMPVELLIVDFLWTLLVGKISNENKDNFKYAGATRFKKSLFLNSDSLLDGIDFQSNRCFQPYYNLYSKWRNGAFKTIEENHANSSNMLICLDLKSFYYSVEFSFNKIKEYLNNDDRLESFEFLTRIIEKIYFEYTKIIVKYKKGIRNQSNTCIFPIGITSTILLRELYLSKFDHQIVSKLSPKYYSRYVDDILIVIPEDMNCKNVNDVIDKHFISTEIIRKSGDSDLWFNGYNNIRIQKDKINCFSFPQNKKTLLLDIYAEVINMNSSEANLLPDIDFLKDSFTVSAYNVENLDISNKIRDLGFLQNNNYKATRFINSLLRLRKNTYVDKNEMSDYFEQIEEFYRGSQSIEYSNNWRAIFELYLICGEKERARELYKSIIFQIDNLSFENIDSDELLEKSKKRLLKHLKADLKEKLEIAAGLTAALNYSFGKTKRVKELAISFRKSNLLNHTLVSYPLLNYSIIETIDLVDVKLGNLPNDTFKLDEFKLKWTPRFINSNELNIAGFIYNLSYGHIQYDPNVINEDFVKFNNLGTYANKVCEYKQTKGETIFHILNVKNYANLNPKIALVNTDISKENVLNSISDPEKNLTWKLKVRLFKILNVAKTEKVDILVFPEFYLPLAWLIDISMFAIKNQITIITGLQYVTRNNCAYNSICSVIPTIIGKRFLTGIVQFREKNFYAPEEMIELSKSKLSFTNKEKPLYYLVDNGHYVFSSILCYEFTDITSRAAFKSKVEMLFVPQLNKDTNYFSAIVEATARDLHCFVIQANTSEYGDSRITAPYKTEKKNILQIKGGETDVVMIATLEVSELLKSRKTYKKDLLKNIKDCFNCTNKNPRKCFNCKSKIRKGKIKGTPPNF